MRIETRHHVHEPEVRVYTHNLSGWIEIPMRADETLVAYLDEPAQMRALARALVSTAEQWEEAIVDASIPVAA